MIGMGPRASSLQVRSGKSPASLIMALVAAAMVLTGCTAAGAGNPGPGSETAAPSDPMATDPTATDPMPPGTSAPGTSAQPPVSVAGATPGMTGSESTAPAVGITVVRLEPGVSDEASGIAASTSKPGAYFLIDDGTGTETVTAVGSDGALLARIAVEGMSASNAEALSSGTCGGPLPDDAAADSCLYVGDIGDNAATRPEIVIYRFAEPDLTDPPADPVLAEQWHYTYPDGAQNAESMMVDTDGSLIIVTKPPAEGALPHRMYRAEPGGGELVLIREFRPPAAAPPFKTLFTGNVVTDLATAPGRVLLLTYDDIQEYTAPDPAAALSSFPDWPHRARPMPGLSQAEGITGALDGCGYTVASEAGPAGKAGALGLASCG